MSTTVDSRVVEMKFDNRHFESNVATTMSTLDKLKQRLNLTGASKGLENVGAAAKGVNLGGLGSAAETVGLKFNAMYTMADQALRNITNRVQHAAENMIKAFTIDPVKTGFQEYETQIGAIQTILANTQSKGTTLEDVNMALDELNAYADKTIYNFTEMTRNIGTFTAAGIDLDTSVTAIQGIANLAAISGSTSQQASTAMYQLSQALASGTVKLMDWNSVVNAGMGGQVFQDALKETARVHGVNIDKMIEQQGSFRETLKDGWITSEILTETLEKFTMTTEGLTEAEIKANREKLKGIGYTEEQIDSIFELGKTSTDAATKVKTWTQLMDTLKEAAQSGWTQTWELLIGDFEQAKALFTKVSDTGGNFINKMSETRNAILGGALTSKWDQLIEKIEAAGVSAEDFTSALKKTAKEHGIDVDKLIEKHGSLGKAFSSGKLSGSLVIETLKNMTSGGKSAADSLDKLNSHTVVAGDTLWDLGKKYGTTWKEIYELNKDIIEDPHWIYPGEVLKLVENVNSLSDAQLKSKGYTDEQIKALRDLAKQAETTGSPINQLIEDLEKPSGRELLIESLANSFRALGQIFTTIKNAWMQVFPPKSTEEKSAQLYKLISRIHDMTKSFGVGSETADKLTRSFKGLFALIDIITTITGGVFKLAFKALSKILGLVDVDILSLTANIGDAIVKVRDWIDSHNPLVKIFEFLAPRIKNVVNRIREWINSLKGAKDLPKAIAEGIANGLGAAFSWVLNTVKNFGKSLKDGLNNAPTDAIGAFGAKVWDIVKIVGQVFVELGKIILDNLCSALGISDDDLNSFVSRVQDAISAVKDWISENNFLTDGLQSVGQGIKDAVSGITDWIKGLEDAEDLPKAIGEGIINGLFHAMTMIGDLIKGAGSGMSGGFDGVSEDLISGLVNGLWNGLKFVVEVIGSIAKALIDKVCEVLGIHSPSTVFMAIGGFILAGLALGIANGESGVLEALKGFGSTLGEKFKEVVGDVEFGDILATALGGGLLYLSNKALNTAGSFTSPLEGLGEMFEGLAVMFKGIGKNFKASALEKQSKALLNIAFAIGIIAVVILVITKINASPGELWNAVAIVGVIAVVMAALMFALNKMTSTTTINKSGVQMANTQGLTILAIAAALLIVAFAIKKIAELDIEDPTTTYTILFGAIGGMAALAIVLSLLTSGDRGANMNKVGKMLLKMSVALLILVYVIKLCGTLDPKALENGANVAGFFALFVLALVAVSKLAGEHADKAAKLISKIAMSLLVIVLVIKLCGLLERDEILRGLTVIAAFGIFCAALIAVSYIAGENAAKAGAMILEIALALLIIAGIFMMFKLIDDGDVERGLSVIKRFGWICVALVAVSKLAGDNAAKAGTMILAISVALLLVVGALFILSQMDSATLDKPMQIITALMLLFGGLMFISKYAKDSMGSLIVLVVAIGVLTAAVIALSFIEPKSLLTATAALSVLIGMFALLALASGKAEGSWQTLLAMTAAIAVMAGALFLLAKCNPSGVLKTAIGLGILMAVMAGVLFVIGKMDTNTGKALKATFSLIILSAALFALVVAIKMLSGVNDAHKKALGLAILMLAMIAVVAILGVIEPQAKKALQGLLCIVILAGALLAFVLILQLMNGVANALKNALALSIMMLAMVGVIYILAQLGPKADEALAGVLAMIGLAAAMVILTQALTVMGGMGWSEIGKSLVVLAGAFLIIGAAAIVLSGCVPVILALGAAFLMIGASIFIAGNGVILMAMGINMLAAALSTGATIIAAGITLILTSIITLIPFLAQQIGVGIVTFCNVIIQAAPMIALAATTLITSFILAIQLIIPLIVNLGVTILSSLIQGIKTLVPQIIDLAVTIITSFLSAIRTLVPQVVETAKTILFALLDGIKELVPKVIETAIDILMSFLNAIADNIHEVVTTAAKIITEFIDGIADSLPDVIQSAVDLMLAFINGLADAIDGNYEAVISAVNRLMDAIVNAVGGWFANITKKGRELVEKLASGISKKVKAAKDAIKEVIDGIVEKIKDKISDLKTAGKDIIDGFIKGIKDKIKDVGDAASEIGKKALESIKGFLGIASPSKEFAKIGRYSDEGLAKGLVKYAGTVETAAAGVGSSALGSMRSVISRIGDAINSDMDTQPTIRPVLDLSDVESGAGAIGGLLGSKHTVGVMRNIGSISTMMNHRSQNGTNSDVVSAIDGLRKDIGELSGSSYNINGVTYDDGSNISEAVKTIVRAARIERRV